MPDIFQAYEPNSSQHRPSLRACEACYARKVKCSVAEDGEKCRQCVSHGVECRPRSRKRKASALTVNDADDAGFAADYADSPAQQRRKDGPSHQSARGNDNLGVSIKAPLLFMPRATTNATSPGSASSAQSKQQRTSSFLSRAAILGEDFQGIDHSHGSRNVRDAGLSNEELANLTSRGAFELPELPLRQSLYEAFLKHCWPWMPVVELDSLNLTGTSDGSSLVVLQAIMLSGAIMRPETCTKATIKEYYRRLKALIQSGYESDPLNTLSALCLIQWYTVAAPKDISTDSPRFWNTYAIGIAHQLGLHKAPTKPSDDTPLRRRIWFTLCARDCATSAAHGRPRLLNPADSDLTPLSLRDFADSEHDEARLFMAYVDATSVLGDLCQLVTRNGQVTDTEKNTVLRRLTTLLGSLPHELRLVDATEQPRAYNLNIAQLHVSILTSVIVLYRPRSVFTVPESAAPSVTAAFLSYRLFQSMQLRADTKFLGSAFAWYLLVAAIPLLSASRVLGIQEQATAALDGLEMSLDTLGEVRPAAANNVKSVRAIRRAVAAASQPSCMSSNDSNGVHDQTSLADLFACYGTDATRLLDELTSLLQNRDVPGTHTSQQQEMRHEQGQDPDQRLRDTESQADAAGHVGQSTAQLAMGPRFQQDDDSLQNAMNQLFQDETLIASNSWMLRDWMDFLPLASE